MLLILLKLDLLCSGTLNRSAKVHIINQTEVFFCVFLFLQYNRPVNKIVITKLLLASFQNGFLSYIILFMMKDILVGLKK